MNTFDVQELAKRVASSTLKASANAPYRHKGIVARICTSNAIREIVDQFENALLEAVHEHVVPVQSINSEQSSDDMFVLNPSEI